MINRRRIAAAFATALLGFAGFTTPAAAVIGGAPVDVASYPWLAAIGSPLFVTRADGQFCEGVLIAPDRLLTAAHCAVIAQFAPIPPAITFGRTDLAAVGGDNVRVKEIRVDPDFRVSLVDGDLAFQNDLAILILDRPLPGPIAEIGAPHGDSGAVVGWGATAPDDWSNTALHTATVPIVPDDRCGTAYGPTYDPATMLCAGSDATDTGQFDSGGPLLVDGRVVAILSWGKSGDHPGVYMRIPALNF
ncbi:MULTISPECIES: trypsin-like serine protease [unclassified Nocardia]|uniref:S1 family peptidase n=1 Tax=unclassified Nocardia TaxID=2637762 RepID=UPI001CE44A93|nr:MULTISPECIES: serine protease [unclassified Nocardia]